MNGKYTFLKWNGKYSQDARFVVKDNSSGKQSVFIPGRTQDLVWTRSNLAEDTSMSDWEDFNNESVDDLESVAF